MKLIWAIAISAVTITFGWLLFVPSEPARAAALSMPTTRPGSVTFSHDVAPIMDANCVSCHHTGEAGPFPLVTYQDVKVHADLIAQVTKSKQMPPWKAEEGYGHFQNERHLTMDQIDTIAQWASDGTPEGNKADLPAAPSFADNGAWQLGKPDLVVKMSKPFTVAADGRDVFRCFVIPLNFTEDKYVTAVEFKPSDKKVVHHALLFLDRRGTARGKEEQWAKDHPDDKQIGFNSFGGPGFLPTGGLGGWAPGATPSFMPEGVARYLAAGSDLVIQTHFHPTGKVEEEQSTVAIYFAKKPPEKVVLNMTIANRQIAIPAGQKNYVVTGDLDVPADLSVVGITPHAHLICKQMDVWATPPQAKSGTAQANIPLIKIDDWDFNWQGQYRYAEPLHLDKGSTLHMRYTYDNSADNERNPNDPPKQVNFGEQTTDEMAFCFLEVTADHPQDINAIRSARLRQLFKARSQQN